MNTSKIPNLILIAIPWLCMAGGLGAVAAGIDNKHLAKVAKEQPPPGMQDGLVYGGISLAAIGQMVSGWLRKQAEATFPGGTNAEGIMLGVVSGYYFSLGDPLSMLKATQLAVIKGMTLPQNNIPPGPPPGPQPKITIWETEADRQKKGGQS